MENISILAAFIAGLLSFFSPCILPLIPSYISYITGISLKDFEDNIDRKKIRNTTVANSLLFIAGFSLVFISFGAAANLAGQFLIMFKEIIRIAGGILIVIFGLFILGVFNIGLLNRYARINLPVKPKGYLGSFVVGIVFAAGWTPCVGPILGSILMLAETQATLVQSIILLAFYSLGLAIPFFIASLAINSFLAGFSRIKNAIKPITIISGILLILIGLMLIFNYFDFVNIYLSAFY